MKQLSLCLTLIGLAACEPMPPSSGISSRAEEPTRTRIEGTTSSATGIRIRGDASVGVVTRL